MKAIEEGLRVKARTVACLWATVPGRVRPWWSGRVRKGRPLTAPRFGSVLVWFETCWQVLVTCEPKRHALSAYEAHVRSSAGPARRS